MIDKINIIFVTFFGIGKIKIAPGTCASFLTAIILFYCFHAIKASNEIIFILLLIIFILSLYSVKKYINDRVNKDPKEVVIDEVIGQSIPLCLYEISHGGNKDSNEAIMFYVYIFVLFRFFDIKKPFPINLIDRKYKNSFGVMFDDIVAGFYTVITLVIFMIIKSKFF
jgi:phosphatidylglycerophosphatase A|tara:strand:+ start:242 stop:745 length:504 start_codon:yes stop_codon:yes gene_type:complete